jgi:hypothetical protein
VIHRKTADLISSHWPQGSTGIKTKNPRENENLAVLLNFKTHEKSSKTPRGLKPALEPGTGCSESTWLKIDFKIMFSEGRVILGYSDIRK